MGDEYEMRLICDVNFDGFGERVYFWMIGLREMLDFLWVKLGWEGCFVLSNLYGFFEDFVVSSIEALFYKG